MQWMMVFVIIPSVLAGIGFFIFNTVFGDDDDGYDVEFYDDVYDYY